MSKSQRDYQGSPSGEVAQCDQCGRTAECDGYEDAMAWLRNHWQAWHDPDRRRN